MTDLPTLLRDIAAETEARARRDLAGYPERMKPHLEEAAELRAGAARVEALEASADALAAMVMQHCSYASDRAEIDSMCLSANEDALEALEALGRVRFSFPDSCRFADWVRVDDVYDDEEAPRGF